MDFLKSNYHHQDQNVSFLLAMESLCGQRGGVEQLP